VKLAQAIVFATSFGEHVGSLWRGGDRQPGFV